MDMGADPAHTGVLGNDPRTRELVEEIMQLSRDFGILSSAASFFADDGGSAPWRGESVSPSSSRFRDYGRVMQESREGLGSIALQRNAVEKKRELSVNKFNRQMDKHGRSVSFEGTAQIAQNGYFNQNGVWMENTVLRRCV